MDAAKLPRWRGFNLVEKCNDKRNEPYREEHFLWMRQWGFDFVRLPLSYKCWTQADDWLAAREPVLAEVDQAVEFGRQYRIHVNINFHRAPGYCVNAPAEPLDLWTDRPALEACRRHWSLFARRYKGVPNERLSFNLLNEPVAEVSEESYARVVRELVAAIRREDPGRLIIADGLCWGKVPAFSLKDLGIAQSTRGYAPKQLTHYKASWMAESQPWALPTWPLDLGQQGGLWDRGRLDRECIAPWVQLESQGVGVHVGEFGSLNQTPHAAVLAWMGDLMGLWKRAGWGWTLWNLIGSFGIMDSRRADVAYEDFHGHKLDRRMLELLLAH